METCDNHKDFVVVWDNKKFDDCPVCTKLENDDILDEIKETLSDLVQQIEEHQEND